MVIFFTLQWIVEICWFMCYFSTTYFIRDEAAFIILDILVLVSNSGENVDFLFLDLQVKREELLQFAQGAISGLKINAELLRFWTNPTFIVFQLLMHSLL